MGISYTVKDVNDAFKALKNEYYTLLADADDAERNGNDLPSACYDRMNAILAFIGILPDPLSPEGQEYKHSYRIKGNRSFLLVQETDADHTLYSLKDALDARGWETSTLDTIAIEEMSMDRFIELLKG